MFNFRIAIIFFSFFLLSCQNESQEVNWDVEKQQIKKLTQQWLKAESNKNLDSSLTFIAKDGIYLANDWPTLRGHEEISTFLKAAIEMPLDTLIGDPEKIEVSASGGMAYEVGGTEVSYNFPEGDTLFKTQYMVVWKKING